MSESVSLPAGLTGAALDIGGTKIAAARFEDGVAVERATEATDRALSGTALISSCRALLARIGADTEAPLGVAATGRVTTSGLWSAVNSGTLPNIVDLPLAESLGKDFSHIAVLNDAAAAAWAEAHHGAAAGIASMVYVTVSTGVGGGFVLGNRLLQSENGLAGHVGFMSARDSETLCGCGRVGTIEAVASGTGIAQSAKAAGYPVSTKEVFDAWRQGELWAESIVRGSARTIADLAASLRSGLGLDSMVLGGSVGLAQGYCELVAEYLDREPKMFRMTVAPAVFGQDSPLIGALLFAADQGIETP